MTTQSFDITMTVTVTDPAALLDAAVAKALLPGPNGHRFYASRDLALEGLTEDDGTPNMEACIQQLLDPGVAPAGMTIDECVVEAFGTR